MSEAINPKAAAITSFCADIIVTFAEGGWGSWCHIHKYKWAKDGADFNAPVEACADPAGTSSSSPTARRTRRRSARSATS